MDPSGEVSICAMHSDCCYGISILLNEYIDQEYAKTHWYCYPSGFPPNWTNTTNTSGVIIDKPIDDFDYGILDDIRDQEVNLAELKRLYVDIPIMLSQIGGAFSIIACTIVIGIFIAILIYQPIIARRCSLRLSVAVSIADMIFSYNQAIPANDFNDWRCTAQAVIQVWAELCSLFFTSAIALNLLLVFVFEFNNTKKIEPFYYAIPILLATVIVAYPLYKSWFGQDYWNCFFRYDYNEEYNRNSPTAHEKYAAKVNEITWIFYTSWMCASIIWCAFVVIAFWTSITQKNRKKQKATSKLGTSSQGEQSTSGAQSNLKMSSNATATGTSTAIVSGYATSRSTGGTSESKSKGGKSGTGTNKIEEKSQKMIQKAVMRIAFYPVVPLVTALPLALTLSIIQLTKIYQFGWFSSIMSNLQGFGNAAIFYFDPAVALARETFRKYMTERYVLKYHPILDNGQRSKTAIQLGRGSNVKEVFMYHFAKFFASRKKDFIVESSKKKGLSKTSTAVNSNYQQPQKTALMEDDPVGADLKKNYDAYIKVPQNNPPMYNSEATADPSQSITNSSVVASSGYNPEASLSASGVESISIDVEEDEDEEIDEAEVLKDIQNF